MVVDSYLLYKHEGGIDVLIQPLKKVEKWKMLNYLFIFYLMLGTRQ